MEKRQLEYILQRLDYLEKRVKELESQYNLEEYFTVQEVANSLKLTPLTIQNKIHAGEIKAIRVGKEYRVSRTDLNGYIIGLSYEPPLNGGQ